MSAVGEIPNARIYNCVVATPPCVSSCNNVFVFRRQLVAAISQRTRARSLTNIFALHVVCDTKKPSLFEKCLWNFTASLSQDSSGWWIISWRRNRQSFQLKGKPSTEEMPTDCLFPDLLRMHSADIQAECVIHGVSWSPMFDPLFYILYSGRCTSLAEDGCLLGCYCV